MENKTGGVAEGPTPTIERAKCKVPALSIHQELLQEKNNF